jgi:lysophospholipase L1-like esterase
MKPLSLYLYRSQIVSSCPMSGWSPPLPPGQLLRLEIRLPMEQFDGQYQQSLARWPDVLARRLEEAGLTIAVLNQGIAGNRVVTDGAGVSALARFGRDVLSQPGVSHVVIFLGISDIGIPGGAFEPRGNIRTADEIIAGYKQLIERMRLRAIKVIGSPLTPFENPSGNGQSGIFHARQRGEARSRE